MDWRETPAMLERARDEHPVVISGPHGDLFGIVTSASPEVHCAGKCVLMFGRNRWQRDRMAVDGARWLAARGFTCLRFDYHGYGESAGPTAMAYSYRPWRTQAVAAIRFMRERMGQERFVLTGLCFDALTALSAFQDEANAIDGIVFVAAPVFEDTAQPLEFRYAGPARTFREKVRAFRGMTGMQRRRVLTVTMLGYTQNARNAARYAFSGKDERGKLSVAFHRSFAALARSSARALFLYGKDDAEYREFQVAERTLFSRLDPKTRARLEIEVWPGQVHPPAATGVQRQVLTRTVNWISAMSAAAVAAPAMRQTLAASN